MSEQVTEQAPEEESPDGGDGDLPEGWTLTHEQPEETIVLNATHGRVQLNPAVYRAEKQINGDMITVEGQTAAGLAAAAQAVDDHVTAFKSDPVGAPLAEAPAVPVNEPVGDNVSEGQVNAAVEEGYPKTVYTDDGVFSEEEWSGRSRSDTIVTEDGQTFFSGVGEQAAAIDSAAEQTAADRAAAEAAATAEQASAEQKQVVYDTADTVDRPGQSAGGTVIVPADVESMEETSQAMDAAKAQAEVERVAETPTEPAPEGEDDDEGDEPDATPAAKKEAEAQGVDLNSVEGTGEGGKITKADVEAAAANG